MASERWLGRVSGENNGYSKVKKKSSQCLWLLPSHYLRAPFVEKEKREIEEGNPTMDGWMDMS